MKISGWGRYPVIESTSLEQEPTSYCQQPFITAGNHRSYGDAALSPFHLPMLRNNCFLSFNDQTGSLICEAGALLFEIIETFLPRGWFLGVTPGTKLITVGGAVAADVHGKNHHISGCFSECVEHLKLSLPNNEVKICSRTENADLFHATCGGMGLTGVITEVSFYLKPVKSQWLEQKTVKTNNLAETFAAFEENTSSTYSVAWIDCLAKGDSIGRSLLMLGEFLEDGDLSYQPKSNLSVPLDLPGFAFNTWSVKAFNALYYGSVKSGNSTQRVGIDSFFYPLDVIENWNRIYGKNGFVQFQFILPKANSLLGLTDILEKISDKGMGSFLAVLKLYGSQNDNWLSFPMEGYSLALDFKMQTGLVEFIGQLTDQVVELGGRVYLAKDALLTEQQFNQSYKNADKFRQFRQDMNLDSSFESLLSKRLNL